MVVVIDNYDSFTYNLVQRLGEIDPNLDIRVFRNDDITIEQIDELSPSRLLVSPGPCTPNEAGISLDCVKHFAGRFPVLGVCLGHQSIGQAFGGKIVRSSNEHYGPAAQVISPFAPINMFDGLESARSRKAGNHEEVDIAFAKSTSIDSIECDHHNN